MRGRKGAVSKAGRAPGGRRGRRTGREALAALLWMAASCAPADRGHGDPDAARVSAPVDADAIVRIEDGPGWDREEAWRLEPDLRLGARDGPAAFGNLAYVGPRRAGGVWTLDRQAVRARAFDDAGREVLSLGGRGDGPGELHGANGMREIADGRVAIFETYPPRVHWFDSAGHWIGTRRAHLADPTGASGDAARFGVWDMGDDGTAFVDAFGLPLPGREGSRRHVLLRVPQDAGGEDAPAADTLLAWTVPPTLPDPTGPIPVLEPQPDWTVGADGTVVWTPGSPYEVRWYPAAGGPPIVARRPVDAERVTDVVREATRAQLGDPAGGVGMPGLDPSLLERLRFPVRLPHVAGLWVSRPDGRVYVARFTIAMAERGGPEVLDVFDSNGAYLGEMEVPEGFLPRAFTPDAAYGVERDALDVPYAVRYRIARPGG